MRILAYSMIVALLFMSHPVWAEDPYNGTKPLLCASVEAVACEPGEVCEKGLPERMGAPQFMRIDFSNKQIVGPKRTTAIRLMELTDWQLTVQGFELGMGWRIGIDRTSGKMMATLIGPDAAYIVFGACTSLP